MGRIGTASIFAPDAQRIFEELKVVPTLQPFPVADADAEVATDRRRLLEVS